MTAVSRLYLGEAFGWDTPTLAKVAISQLRDLRDLNVIDYTKCPGKQLTTNSTWRLHNNIGKVLSYIPVINVIFGALMLYGVITDTARAFPVNRPQYKQFLILRSVLTILTGPLLAIVDLVKFIYDNIIAAKYKQAHPEKIAAFNTSHDHGFNDVNGHFIAGHSAVCCTS